MGCFFEITSHLYIRMVEQLLMSTKFTIQMTAIMAEEAFFSDCGSWEF